LEIDDFSVNDTAVDIVLMLERGVFPPRDECAEELVE